MKWGCIDEKKHRDRWYSPPEDRYCNYSAFSGYRRTPSDYSQIHCGECGRTWRSKGIYVELLPGADPGPEKENNESPVHQ